MPWEAGDELMPVAYSASPDVQALTAVLRTLVGPSSGDVPLSITDRRQIHEGTYPKEVLSCRIGDGPEVRFFCKYSDGNDDAHPHRGGVGYEAEIYRRVLGPMETRTLAFTGVHEAADAGQTWLILEHLERAMRVHVSADPGAMGRAAHWIGLFHTAGEAWRSRPDLAFLKSYDAEYYRGWASRTFEKAGPWRHRFPWAETLNRRFDEIIAILTSEPSTIIHGEYYSKNILYRDGRVYPVDWETAAIGPGEIDLVFLCDGWSEESARETRDRYCEARWPQGVPGGFERRLDAVRAYMHCRWLGDQRAWKTADGGPKRMWELRAAGERLGLL
ncbi:MAG: phosphotransferase family protein [Planctomycetota bacterium]